MKRRSIIGIVVFVAGAALLPLIAALRSRAPMVSAATRIPSNVPSTPASAQTRTKMHNVFYRFDESLAVHIRRLQGRLVPAKNGAPPIFDDKRSFSISIDSAELAISSAALTALMNKYVFADPAAPIKNLKITMEGTQMKQAGTVHKGVDLPFEMRAEVSATAEGTIRLHPHSLKVIHVPVKGALHTFGLHLADLVDPKRAPGVRIERDDLILDPSKMLPPPKIQGRITAVKIEGDNLVEVIGTPAAMAHETTNYMKYTGGTIRFGKLTMHDADLSLIDSTPQDPFDFSLDRYKEQLVAGYSKTTPAFGLDVFMPDLSKLGQSDKSQAHNADMRK